MDCRLVNDMFVPQVLQNEFIISTSFGKSWAVAARLCVKTCDSSPRWAYYWLAYKPKNQDLLIKLTVLIVGSFNSTQSMNWSASLDS